MNDIEIGDEIRNVLPFDGGTDAHIGTVIGILPANRTTNTDQWIILRPNGTTMLLGTDNPWIERDV